MEAQSGQHRVRKRTSNACVRCRQQKIRCSGTVPCQQCSKRNLACSFDNRQKNVLVSREFIADLERRALSGDGGSTDISGLYPDRSLSSVSGVNRQTKGIARRNTGRRSFCSNQVEDELAQQASAATPSVTDEFDGENRSDSEESDRRTTQEAPDQRLNNPLAQGDSGSYTADVHGKPVFFGVTSNWSYGRRVLSMIHERVCGTPLPVENLLFQGSTYDIGWDGLRSHGTQSDACTLPTADFAMFLINAVKFHCGQLFHLFDEPSFMQQFNVFHEAGGDSSKCPPLWYVHYLLILAFGKAFIVRVESGRRPPGAELFAQAMKLLPDMTFLCTEPLQAVEVLCSAALYLHCLDSRSAAYNLIGQAMRVAIEQGMHTNMQSHHLDNHISERRRSAFWTIYILDRYMSSLMGGPLTLSDEDITASLPSFLGVTYKSVALSNHVKISQATAVVMQTIYRRSRSDHDLFLKSIKEALKIVASANDERNSYFPLDPQEPAGGISRLSAYLHIFHHQCILLATRPLLFSLWQKRLDSPTPIRVRSQGGVRSLLRVCVSSAQQTIRILEKLQSQSLLESFLPFDLDAVFTSAIVLFLAAAVDPSLLRNHGSWSQNIHLLLDEMICRGNLIAKFHKSELQQLDEYLQRLEGIHRTVGGRPYPLIDANDASNAFFGHPMDGQTQITPDQVGDWNSDIGLNGDQLTALADSLDFGQLDWLDTGLY